MGQSHYIDVYGYRNFVKGMHSPDAIVKVTPRPYIADGRPQYEISIEAELSGGESDFLPPEVLRVLVQEAAKACVNKCVAQMMHIRLAKDAKLGIENLYWLTDGRMRVDNHYKAVLIGSDAGKEKTYMLATPALIRESAEGLNDDELADYLIQSFAGWGVIG